MIRPEIRVLTDHSPEQPNRVFFEYHCQTNNDAWLCVKCIMEFLDLHDIDYTVHAFQANQTLMEIPSPEDRTILRLAFPLAIDERRDDSMDGYSGTSILII